MATVLAPSFPIAEAAPRPRVLGRPAILVMGTPSAAQALRSLRADGFDVELGDVGTAGARTLALAVIDVSQDLDAARSLDGLLEAVPAVPFVVITAPGHAARICALEAGADVVVSAPVHPGELLARVRATLRRARSQSVRAAGDVSLDRVERTVHGPRGRIPVRTREFDLLWVMAGRPNAVFTRTRLAAAVWNDAIYPGSRTIDVHVGQLRAKLTHQGVARARLTTVWGVGYRLEVDPS